MLGDYNNAKFRLQLCSRKVQLQKDHLLDITSCLSSLVFLVKVLGLLKKEDNEKDDEDFLIFQLFQIDHLRTVSHHCICYCRPWQPTQAVLMLMDTSVYCTEKLSPSKC